MSPSKLLFIALIISSGLLAHSVLAEQPTSGLQRQKRASLIAQAEQTIRRGGVDSNNVDQLISLVEQNSAQTCLMRVICDVAHNPKSHGDQGNKFAQALLKFQKSPNDKVKPYVAAMTADCARKYTTCNYQMDEVIKAGNILLRVK